MNKDRCVLDWVEHRRRYAHISDESDSGAVKPVAGAALYVLVLAPLGALVFVVGAEGNGAAFTRAINTA